MLNANANMEAAISLRESELGATTLKIPPTQIAGTVVQAIGDTRQKIGNEWWQTLLPLDYENDSRAWEFSLTSGRLVQTQF